MSEAVRSGGLVANMDYVYENYPSVEARLSAARALGKLRGDGLLQTAYAGHNVLACHWGDMPEQHLYLARYLDDLKEQADNAAGEAMIVFRQGTPEKALSLDGMLAQPIVFEYGTIKKYRYSSTRGKTLRTVAGLGYEYIGRDAADPQRPARLGRVQAPLVIVRAGIDLIDRQTVSAEFDAEISENGSEDKLVPVYNAVLSAAGDLALYQRQRTVVRQSFIIGNEAVRRFLHSVQDRLMTTGNAPTLASQLQSKPHAA